MTTISEVSSNSASSSSLWQQDTEVVQASNLPVRSVSDDRLNLLLERLKKPGSTEAAAIVLFLALVKTQRENRAEAGQITHQKILAEQQKHKDIHKEAQRIYDELEKSTTKVDSIAWLQSLLLGGTIVAALLTVGGVSMLSALAASSGVSVSVAAITEFVTVSGGWIAAISALSNATALTGKRYYEVEMEKKKGEQFKNKELAEASKRTLEDRLDENNEHLKKLTSCYDLQQRMQESLEAAMHEKME